MIITTIISKTERETEGPGASKAVGGGRRLGRLQPYVIIIVMIIIIIIII